MSSRNIRISLPELSRTISLLKATTNINILVQACQELENEMCEILINLFISNFAFHLRWPYSKKKTGKPVWNWKMAFYMRTWKEAAQSERSHLWSICLILLTCPNFVITARVSHPLSPLTPLIMWSRDMQT